jgi:hypothetical protein
MTTTWNDADFGRIAIDQREIDTVEADCRQADASPEPTLTALALDLDRAHMSGVVAASAGLQDPALGASRLTGNAVATLAEAAISSATPFLRAPLLSRLSRVERLHPRTGRDDGRCPACGVPAPCDTALELRW